MKNSNPKKLTINVSPPETEFENIQTPTKSKKNSILKIESTP